MNVFQLPEIFNLYPSKATYQQKEEEKQQTGEQRMDKEELKLRHSPPRSGNSSASPCLSKSGSSDLEVATSRQENIPRHNSNEGWLSLMTQSLQRGQQQAMEAFFIGTEIIEKEASESKKDLSPKDPKRSTKEQDQRQDIVPESESVTYESESSDVEDSVDFEGEACADIEMQLSPSESSQESSNISRTAESEKQISSESKSSDLDDTVNSEDEGYGDIEIQLSPSGSSQGTSDPPLSPDEDESEKQCSSVETAELGSIQTDLPEECQTAQHTISTLSTFSGGCLQEAPEEDAELRQKVPQHETVSTGETSHDDQHLHRISCGESSLYRTRNQNDSPRSQNELLQEKAIEIELAATASRAEANMGNSTSDSREEPMTEESAIVVDSESGADELEVHVDELAEIMNAYALSTQARDEHDKESTKDYDSNATALKSQSDSVQSDNGEGVSLQRSLSRKSTEESNEIEMTGAEFSRIMNAYTLQNQNQNQNLDEESHTGKTCTLGEEPLEVTISSLCDSIEEERDDPLDSDESSEIEMDPEDLLRIMSAYNQQNKQQKAHEGDHSATCDNVPKILHQENLDENKMGESDDDEVHVNPKEFARIMNAYMMQESENAPHEETRTEDQSLNEEVASQESLHAPFKELRVNCQQTHDDDLYLDSTSTEDSGELVVDMGELARIMQMYEQQTPKQNKEGQDTVPSFSNEKQSSLEGPKEEITGSDRLSIEENAIGVDRLSSELQSCRNAHSEVNEGLRPLSASKLSLDDLSKDQAHSPSKRTTSDFDMSEQEKLKTCDEVNTSQNQESDCRRDLVNDVTELSTVETSSCRQSPSSRWHQKEVPRPKGFFPGSDKANTLIRELKHLQAHGSKMFEAIDEKIQLWRQEETRYQQEALQNIQESQEGTDAQPGDCHALAEEAPLGDRHPDGMPVPIFLQERAKPPPLIRELQHIQFDGPDMLKGIGEKVKAWQSHETQQQQVGHARTEDFVGSVLSTITEPDPYKLSQSATSEHTESTHSCTISLSSTFRSPGKTPWRQSGEEASESNETGATEANGFDLGELNGSLHTESGLGEWDASACMTALVEEVLNDAAVHSLEKDSYAREECIFTEETVCSDEVEPPVVDSFDEGDEKQFDFDNMSTESGESYGFVGHGVSDNMSVISELSIPTVVSHCAREIVPAPTVVLRHVNFIKRRQNFRSNVPIRPKLRRVQLAKLRRVKSNPPRLPRMRDAAALCLYGQQLKQLRISDHFKETQEEGDQWNVLRRCNSDVPASDAWLVAGRYDSEYDSSVAFLKSSWGDERCILDCSWDEVEEVGSATKRAFSQQFEALDDTESLSEESTSIIEEITVESSYEEVTVHEQDDVHESEEAPPMPAKTLGTTSIRKSDSFYNRVSVSFLGSSIADTVVIEVLGEALRILRGGGILNILDINGAIIKRLKQFPQLDCLAFQQVTAKDQDRIGTNTMSILEKSGLKSPIHANDPRIVHWTATKPEGLNPATV